MSRSLSSPLINSSHVKRKSTKDSTTPPVILKTDCNDETNNKFHDNVKSDENNQNMKQKDTWLSIDMEENTPDTFIAKEEDMV